MASLLLIALTFVLFVGASVGFIVQRARARKAERAHAEAESHRQAWARRAGELEQENHGLARYRAIIDVEQEVAQVRAAGQNDLVQAQLQAARLVHDAQQEATRLQASGQSDVLAAGRRATQIVEDARLKAEQTAGEALKALANVENLRREAKALDNVINGYGDRASDAQRAKYEAQLAELAQKLQAAEEKNQRALSMAQQTKRGHVYVISNIGSFGEDVFKIGLTRRLEPLDRVRELGDASVPFEFDVHAMIQSDDAPALEHSLHRHFMASQMNKVNPRKEFFRVNVKSVREEIEKLGIQAAWTMKAAAAHYRESLAIDKAIRENPASYQAWVNKQLVLEATVPEELEVAEAS